MRWHTANNRRKSKFWREVMRPKLAERLRRNRLVTEASPPCAYPGSPNRTQFGELLSPEHTGIWQCPACPNNVYFIGVDEHGYGGPEECGQNDACIEECTCLTVLRQPVTVKRNAENHFIEVDYASFTGGGVDAEIGAYTRVECALCGAVVYQESDHGVRE